AADEIEESTPLFSALWTIARVEVFRGNAAAALRVTEKMENKSRRAGLLGALISDQVRAGDLTGALKMAERLKDKDNALMAVGIAPPQAGRVEEALRISAACSPLARAAALAEVAQAQARAGQRDKARANLTESRRLWEKVIHPSSRPQSLANHAIAQAECG